MAEGRQFVDPLVHKKRLKRYTRVGISLFFIMISPFLLCIGCNLIIWDYAVDSAEQWMNTELPPEAKNVRGQYNWGMQGNDTFQIRFDLSPADFASFEQRFCLNDNYNPFDDSALALSVRPQHLVNQLTFRWWSWEQVATNYAGSYGGCGKRNNYRILVDKTNSKIYRVYLWVVGPDK